MDTDTHRSGEEQKYLLSVDLRLSVAKLFRPPTRHEKARLENPSALSVLICCRGSSDVLMVPLTLLAVSLPDRREVLHQR